MIFLWESFKIVYNFLILPFSLIIRKVYQRACSGILSLFVFLFSRKCSCPLSFANFQYLNLENYFYFKREGCLVIFRTLIFVAELISFFLYILKFENCPFVSKLVSFFFVFYEYFKTYFSIIYPSYFHSIIEYRLLR